MLPLLEAEAKERQGRRTDLKNIEEILPQCRAEQSRDKAAEMVGVSGKYVSDIKAISNSSPAVLKQIEASLLISTHF